MTLYRSAAETAFLTFNSLIVSHPCSIKRVTMRRRVLWLKSPNGVENTAVQRPVNTKEYRVTDKGIDPSRITVATGAGDDRKVEDYWCQWAQHSSLM
jgi:hypothetical protein